MPSNSTHASPTDPTTRVPIEISARHGHLHATGWKSLFGDQPIEPARQLSQAPQFVAHQRVKLRGPGGELAGIGVVGPLRPYAQVELAPSDARRIGLRPPVADSGHLDQAADVTIIGPAGEITIPAAIIQQRHVHASPADAQRCGLRDRQIVALSVPGPRGGRLENVLVRIHEGFSWRVHLDTDEANALGLTQTTDGYLVTTV